MGIKHIFKHIKRPQNIIYRVFCSRPEYIKSDKLYLRMRYSLCLGKHLHLKNPRTYNEKLQWLKLYNHDPEYTTMVDKYSVKKLVISKIGDRYVIPTIAVYSGVEEIDYETLPDQFVLKTTHDSGSIVICKDKKTFNWDMAKRKLNYALANDNYTQTREWPYKNVPRRIIAEEYISPNEETNDLPDYKFFCFNGEVKALLVATERHNPKEEVKFDFFDADFNPLPFKQGHDHAKVIPQKPNNFEEMKDVASKLSKGIPHVRVDLYDTGDKVLFGELTFFHFSGFTPFEPEDWDKRFGEMISLPEKKRI